jgi:hypothetical protein
MAKIHFCANARRHCQDDVKPVRLHWTKTS